MTGILRWIWGKIGLYFLLVTALVAVTIAAPIVKQSFQAEERALALQQASAAIVAERSQLLQEFHQHSQTLTSASDIELSNQHQRLSLEKQRLTAQIADAKPAWILAVANPQQLLAVEQQKLQLAFIEQQLGAVEAAQNLLTIQMENLSLNSSLSHQTAEVAQLQVQCSSAKQKLAVYEDNWHWKLRRWIESADHKQLIAERRTHCDKYGIAARKLHQLTEAQRQAEQINSESQAAFIKLRNEPSILKSAGQQLANDNSRAQTILTGTFPNKIKLWAEDFGLRSILVQAAMILTLVILTPLLVRLLSYYVLAPAAMRRGTILLNIPVTSGARVRGGVKSQISLAITLKENEELLVRQSYLQSSSLSSQTATRWLLDHKRPFTSLAAGLAFLTQIRGQGEITTVSAVRDGFSELNTITLASGTACVLQPRALAAVVQPIGQPVRITSHWRIFSLNAWLTMQLRYLVFHGPADLIVKGGRGVRVEAAQAGWLLGQNQLIGFSPDLSYSVSRTETFWPYFLGREPLLKDRVMMGEGVLIIEEAPQSSRDGKPRRSIEVVVDAILKLFGL
jgi:hypothetical protein